MVEIVRNYNSSEKRRKGYGSRSLMKDLYKLLNRKEMKISTLVLKRLYVKKVKKGKAEKITALLKTSLNLH